MFALAKSTLRILAATGAITGATLGGGPLARAADPACAPILNVHELLKKAPGSQAFSSSPTAAEKLMIITTSEAVYVRDQGGGWRKALERQAAEKQSDAAHAQSVDLYRECKAVGKESVNGTPTTVYQYAYSASGIVYQAKMWLGADGLPRKAQRGDGSTMRYEYGNFKAPL